MAVLQCEICGGKLMAKSGGLFECEYCGMQYDKTRIQEMVQEIKGTVKVEGTVEVQGTVKIDGPVKVEGGVSVHSLCDRGFFELENGAASAAKEAFERALDMNISWGDVYMGLIMCECNMRGSNREDFRGRLLRHEFDKHRHLHKFLDNPGSAFHQKLVTEYRDMCAREKEIIRENHRRGRENAAYYRSLRKKYSPVRGRITADGTYILDKFGTLYSDSKLWGNDFQAETHWENMIWISKMNLRHTSMPMLMGMYANGTVIAESKEQRVEVFDPDDHVTEMMGAGTGWSQGFVGLRQDGSLVTACSGDQTETIRQRLADCKKAWENQTIEALCEFSGDWQLHVAAPNNSDEDYPVWKETSLYSNMVAVLQGDGTARLLGSDYITLTAQVELWGDLIQVVPGETAVAGLKADGSVVYAFSCYRYMESTQRKVEKWRDIVYIRMIKDDVIAVRRDGTLVTTSDRYARTLGVDKEIQLFESIDTLSEALASTRASAYAAWTRDMAAKKAEALAQEEKPDPNVARREALQQQLQAIHKEMDGLKGIFSIKRRKELEEKMGSILLELDELA